MLFTRESSDQLEAFANSGSLNRTRVDIRRVKIQTVGASPSHGGESCERQEAQDLLNGDVGVSHN